MMQIQSRLISNYIKLHYSMVFIFLHVSNIMFSGVFPFQTNSEAMNPEILDTNIRSGDRPVPGIRKSIIANVKSRNWLDVRPQKLCSIVGR